MKRILFAVLLAAAPAFADRSDRHHRDDDDRRQGDWSGGWDDEQYDWAQSDGTEGGWDADDGAYAQDSGPTFDDFRSDSELNWSGDWVETPQYGTVWRPTHVGDEWQPYLYGRWVWTDAGWAWASDEPFGWAVYHYGRWAWSPAMGWMWVPGRIWAPAWVAWRWTDGYAAWCPLGPRSVIVDRPALWVVVPSRRFLEPVRHNVVPRPQRQALPLPPRPGPRAGPPVTVVERVVGRTVRPLAVGNAGTPASARTGPSSIDFFRPRTAPIATQPRPRPQEPRMTPSQGQGQPPRVVAPPAGQAPRPTAQGPRAGWPASSPPPAARERPPSAPQAQPPPGPRVVAPRPAAPAEAHPGNAPAPHATAPVQRSGAEQPQAKER